LNRLFFKQFFIFIIKLAVAGGLFYWLIKNDQIDFQSVADASLSPLHVLGFSAVLGGGVVSAMRWGLLLRLQGLRFTKRIVIRWTLISNFFGLALPGLAGSELARAYYMFKSAPHAKTAALSSIFIDRILAMTSLMLMGFLAFLAVFLTSDHVDSSILFLGGTMGAVLISSVLGFFLITFNPVRRLIQTLIPGKYSELIEGIIAVYSRKKLVLLQSFGFSFIAHMLILSAFFFSAEILSTDVEWKELAVVMPLVMVSAALPITPAGIGVGETAAAFIFALFGIGNGATIMLVARIWIVAVQLLGGVIYLFHRHEEAA